MGITESILLELLSAHIWIIHLGDVCPVVNSCVELLSSEVLWTTHHAYVRIILLVSIIPHVATHHIILHHLPMNRISKSLHDDEVSPVDRHDPADEHERCKELKEA